MSGEARLGIPQLERLLAPIPEHATLVFLNEPGVDAEPFLYQVAHGQLAAGRAVVYAATNRAPDAIRRAMREFGFDDDGRLLFLDAYSALLGGASDAAYLQRSPGNLDEFASLVERAAREHPDAVFVVDSLSQLVDQSGFPAFEGAFPRIHGAMRAFRMSAALFTRWPYDANVDALLSAFGACVSLHGVQERVVLSQYFRLERAAWRAELDPKPRLYKALRPGGVHVYIPKIVVTGPYNAGKSSFVQAMADTAVSVDQLGTTVALDHGRATLDGLTADVFGTPGQARFDPILKIVSGQALGVIVVVDSTKPDSFPRAREMMELTWRKGLPGIIAANKQDLPDALPPEEVARLIGPPPGVRVVGCVGRDRDSSRAVLRQLIDQILTTEVAA